MRIPSLRSLPTAFIVLRPALRFSLQVLHARLQRAAHQSPYSSRGRPHDATRLFPKSDAEGMKLAGCRSRSNLDRYLLEIIRKCLSPGVAWPAVFRATFLFSLKHLMCRALQVGDVIYCVEAILDALELAIPDSAKLGQRSTCNAEKTSRQLDIVRMLSILPRPLNAPDETVTLRCGDGSDYRLRSAFKPTSEAVDCLGRNPSAPVSDLPCVSAQPNRTF